MPVAQVVEFPKSPDKKPRLRRIEPMIMPEAISDPNLGPRPTLRWVNPRDLYVDETYQRDLSKRSISLIQEVVKKFAWNRMKPPIVVESDGVFHVLDGQHTAIAAATLNVPEIPIFVVEAKELDERARAFVGHNTDRVIVTPLAIHRALSASGDPDALDVDNVCNRAGVRFRHLNTFLQPNAGDTMAVNTIRGLVKRNGVIKARTVLECLVKARRAPISAEEIKAVEHLLIVEEANPTSLTRVVRIEGDDGLNAARGRAKIDRVPIWRSIADRWLLRLRRRER